MSKYLGTTLVGYSVQCRQASGGTVFVSPTPFQDYMTLILPLPWEASVTVRVHSGGVPLPFLMLFFWSACYHFLQVVMCRGSLCRSGCVLGELLQGSELYASFGNTYLWPFLLYIWLLPFCRLLAITSEKKAGSKCDPMSNTLGALWNWE